MRSLSLRHAVAAAVRVLYSILFTTLASGLAWVPSGCDADTGWTALGATSSDRPMRMCRYPLGELARERRALVEATRALDAARAELSSSVEAWRHRPVVIRRPPPTAAVAVTGEMDVGPDGRTAMARSERGEQPVADVEADAGPSSVRTRPRPSVDGRALRRGPQRASATGSASDRSGAAPRRPGKGRRGARPDARGGGEAVAGRSVDTARDVVHDGRRRASLAARERARAADARAGSPPSTSPSKSDSCIDIRSASESALEALPGVGPSRARKIVKRRARKMFTRPRDITRVKGIGPATFGKMKPQLCPF